MSGYSFISWLAIPNRLSIRDRQLRWGTNVVDPYAYSVTKEMKPGIGKIFFLLVFLVFLGQLSFCILNSYVGPSISSSRTAMSRVSGDDTRCAVPLSSNLGLSTYLPYTVSSESYAISNNHSIKNLNY